MIGNNRNRYCLMNSVIITVAATAALSLALLSADELDHHGKTVNGEGSAADCLTCHDGSNEPQRRGLITPRRSHRVLIKYPPPGRGLAFKPLQEVLAAGMKLENDMVTCISCHDLNNPEKNHLAFETNTTGFAQKLCYVCHLDIN
jgi:hypothetical protein